MDCQAKSIKEMYRGAEVFITGASGFLGKVLVEKLLRSCPEIDKVYLLLRPKKGQRLEERIQVITNSLLFENLKNKNPACIKKLEVIEGDARSSRLGISEVDREKLKTCTVIFHLAACVRFDDQLSDAIKLNTCGTREICELAKTMPLIKSIVYISTAYVQPKNFHIQEKLFPSTCDWRQYITFAEKLDEDTLNAVTMKLTDFAPNTYSFTKFLAEQVCNDYRKNSNLPIIIYRPSIVSFADSEPGGYCDSLNGANSLFVLYLSGIKRVHRGSRLMLDMIPVDICVKGMIAASAKHEKVNDEMSSEIPVYNASSVATVSLPELMEIAKSMIANSPLEKSIGLPSLYTTSGRFLGLFLLFWFQIVPAFLIDSVLRIFRQKPFMMKYQRILANVENSLTFFFNNIFTFETERYHNLVRSMKGIDKEEFDMNPKMDKFEYFRQGYQVTKGIVLKETEKSEEIAKSRRPYWKTLTILMKMIFYTLLYKSTIAIFNFVKT